MGMITPKELEKLHTEYPNGTKVILERMQDPQAPPIGTTGEVYGIDSTGSLLVHWSNGSSLNVVWHEDIVRKAAE